ncbi:hypothetical protein [Thalassotalea eurytherma]|uniref:Uncharacterized protein n=1 Tax=Thalassotalea eurytherma TaxID=1144278 RepID=A0ABQ6H2S3_9GAMM|nr:hypothetical protein [Thalassotalea eurytherma]GLX82473.1 hypothetical protein theurythT_19250 [Thalassotalea eurytherma]
MSLAKKGTFSVSHFCPASVLYKINIKQARAFFIVLTTIATSLACYLLYFIRQDIQLWLLENNQLSTIDVAQVRVDDVWVQPNDFVDIGYRLFSLSFEDNQPHADELMRQLIVQTRTEIAEYSNKKKALVARRNQTLSRLANEVSELNHAIQSIVFYDRIPATYQQFKLDKSNLLAKLKGELKLAKSKQRSQPLHYNSHIRAISRLETGLSKQLNNLIANRRFEIIAKERGKVVDVHPSSKTSLNFNRPLITLSDHKTPAVQSIYLFNAKSPAFQRTIDRRLKKAAFEYLNL